MATLEFRDYLTVFGICAATSTGLLIAYLHRRQMRQNEAYRLNPELGLIPPPTPVWLFLKRHALFLVTLANGFSLIAELVSSKPITRLSVFSMGMSFASLILFLLFRAIDRIYTLMDRIYTHLLRHAEMFQLLGDSAKQHTELLDDTMKVLEPPIKPS
jgi:hypothetical protein